MPHGALPDAPARHPQVSAAATPRLQWVFIALVTLSVLSVFAVSSRMGSGPNLQDQTVSKRFAEVQTKGIKEAASLSQFDKQNEERNASYEQELPLSPAETDAVQDVVIPRIIHQSWKSADSIPTRFSPWMQSWREFHPSWTYVFWTDEDNMKLFEELYPQYLHVAKAVKKVSLADMARYALLHQVGGLYVDADFECFQPFDDLHREHRLFLSSEPLVHTVLLERSTTAALCNALMASAPGHPFWLRVLDNIKDKFERERRRSDAVSLTGPRIVKQTYLSDQALFDASGVVTLPSEYFYPEVAYWNIEPMESACKSRKDAAAVEACAWLRQYPHGQFTNHTHAAHHWQCTWCRDAHLDAFSTLSSVLPSALRPNISSSGITFIP